MNTEPHLLRAVFHVHTDASPDCDVPVDQLIARCLDEGIDVLAVTDHNEISGAFAAKAQAPFQVIVGEEIRAAEGGDIIGLFLQQKIEKDLPARRVFQEIRRQGGLVYLAHPYDTVRMKRWPPDLADQLAPEADIIEVFNAHNLHSADNRKAEKAARRFNKAPCAGADAHALAEIGRTVVFLPPFENPRELLESLRAARFQRIRPSLWTTAARVWRKLRR